MHNHVIVHQVTVHNNMVTVDNKNTFNAKSVLVGHSPLNDMTRFSGGYGNYYLGNSLLLQMEDDSYIFIGKDIYRFRTLDGVPINKYISPVGNNGMPYPYAIDSQGNYYLLIEQMVVTNMPHLDKDSDPYAYYYKHQPLSIRIDKLPLDI